jgi:membrane-bound serine protease (ClpP class)
MRVRWIGFLLAALLLGFAWGAQPTRAQSGSPAIITMRMAGALHPAMLEHLKRAQQIALNERAELIIIELDTPGGEIDLMTSIIESITGSKTPVVIYVAPSGAMAGSAGALVTLAGQIAAMAPQTAIGASSPVGPGGEDLGQTLQSKYKGILKATVRSIAVNRPPDAIKIAEDMIDTARAVSVDEALQAGLIDIKANNTADLLRQLDGRQVTVGGEKRTLHTLNARMVDVPRTFMEELLMVLANPNIAFLLLAIGVQAILIEISSPGGWVAGFIGVVCLLLATYGMGLLPVNWFGLLFLVLAFALFLLDIKAPTHGALTAAGVASFIAGALVLFNSPNVPSFQRVSVPLVVGTGIFIGAIFFVIIGFALRAQARPLLMTTSVVGKVGTVNTPLTPVGTVQLGSELWTAVLEESAPPAAKGTRVEVTSQERLRIHVRRIKE